jgi:hypothetical protein
MRALAAAILIAAIGPANAADLSDFGPGAKCPACEASQSLHQSFSVPIPEHAIVLDSGNGVFWQNSRLIVVDLDAGETRTYQFPRDKDGPTALRLGARQSLAPEKLQDLVAKANNVWNPPASKPPKVIMMRTDIFETLYVVNGARMARWTSIPGDPAWYAALTEAVRNSEAPR